MSSATSISVVIPLYNKVHWIGRTIRSVMEQTVAPAEVIVVDDGSTDGSREAAAGCGDPRVRVVMQNRRGPGAARNAGARMASGEYIVFLDADDVWAPQFLEKTAAILDAHPAVAAVATTFIRFPGREDTTDWARSYRGISTGVWRLASVQDPLAIMRVLPALHPTTTLFRREVLLELGGFFDWYWPTLGEDESLMLKMAANHDVYFLLEPLAEYHTECSAVSAYSRRPVPVECFLRNPEFVTSAIPERMSAIVGEILAQRALATARRQALDGRMREALHALTAVPLDGVGVWRRMLALTLCCASPMLPWLRAVKRGTRSW